MQIISSQRYLNDEVVAKKIANEDFEVTVSPAFIFEGKEYCVVLDGHHSLAAAKEAGVAPIYVEANSQDDDRVCLLERGDIEDFLEVTYMDSDWHDVETGYDLW